MTGDASPQVEGDELPEGWKLTSIGTHYAFKNGLNKARRFFGQGTPIINYMDVYSNQRLSAADIEGKVTVTNDEADAYSAYQGDAFFTRTSETVSEVGYSAVLLEPVQRAVFSGFVLRGRPKNKGLLPEFAAYALRARDVRKQIETRATYTTRALTNGGSLSECTFPLPPEPEQKRIAQALSDIDDLIASLDALIAKKRDIKQGAMQELLTGKRRLPGFSQEWSAVLLKDVADLDPANLGAGTVADWRFNYVSLEDVSHGVLLGHTETAFADAPSRARRIVARGDILFGTVRPNLKSHCIFDLEGTRWVASTGFCVIRCRQGKSDANFIFEQIMSQHVDEQIERIIAGSNYPAVSSRDVGALVIALPEIEEQRAIAGVMHDMSAEIAHLSLQKAKLDTLRQGMMQQLLTGRIRLL